MDAQEPIRDSDVSLQLIDENKTFHPETFKYFQDVEIDKCGLNYHIVSVFGSQSTGKSTLLNALFGTRFDVMDETKRSQTTKGIWMALAKKNKTLLSTPKLDLKSSTNSDQNILVLDVEGTDGRERGEDQDFERKSALFALATSEVLIVNMWENQVGLYQGANMGLLKTVFEVNLSLFQTAATKPNRSLILFVIRDHLGTTPLANLQATVIADLKRIWESLSKPSAASNSNLDDFFDLQFYALPHKVLMPDQFSAETSKLSNCFVDPSSSSYVFKPEYHRGLPIDGWPIYTEKIWEQIEDNKDLDLPTQQILVARFRCEEIANQAWQSFETGLIDAQSSNNNKLGSSFIVPNFGPIITTIRSGTLEIFDSLASRYEKSVYTSKRLELLNKVDSRLNNLYKAQLIALHKKAVADFNTEITQSLSIDRNLKPFVKVVSLARDNAIKQFVEGATEASVDEHVFTHTEELFSLEQELDEVESKLKKQEIQKITIQILRKVKNTFYHSLESFFDQPKQDTWDEILEFFDETVKSALSSTAKFTDTINGSDKDFSSFDFGVGATEKENEKSINEIRAAAWIALDSRLKEVTRDDNVLLKLREKFEDLFRYDSNGVPRVWKAGDDIETPFVKAREETLKILPIFAIADTKEGKHITPDVDLDEYYNNHPDEASEDGSQVQSATFFERLSRTRQQNINKKFKRQADAYFVEAKRSTTQVFSRIPAAFYLILLLLGWNELMAVLRNPLLFALCLLTLGGAYVAYNLNLIGPIFSVSGAMIERTKEISKQKLREILEVPSEIKHSNVKKESVPVEEYQMDDLSEKKAE